MRTRTKKQLETIRARRCELDKTLADLAYDVAEELDGAEDRLAAGEAEAAELDRQMSRLEAVSSEASRRVTVARVSRRAEVVDQLKALLLMLDDRKRHAIEQAAFAFAAWEEKALTAAMAASLAYSLADSLHGLTGDTRFNRIYHLEFAEITREDQAERFRTMLRHEVRDRRKAGGAPVWQQLVDEARALSVPSADEQD